MEERRMVSTLSSCLLQKQSAFWVGEMGGAETQSGKGRATPALPLKMEEIKVGMGHSGLNTEIKRYIPNTYLK